MSLDKKVIREVVAPIRDATANPVNVDKGLVFYNNDGRQVGERTQGEILEKVIPSGTPLIEDGASYNHMIIQNVASFDASASASLTQGAIIYAGVNAAALQYKSSTSVAMLRKHSFDVNIVIADIREFTFKVGDNSFNLSFGKDYFGLTKNVYAQLANSKGSSVPISPNDNYSFLMLNIEKGVIKKVSIGINTYRAETQTNVEIAFKINTVARSIIDATAVPSDVASGKTFYNNDGKQVGTCVDLPLIFSQQITIKGGLENHEEGQFGLNGVRFGIYTYRDFDMFSFASSFGYLSRRHGFLKIPVSNINKILIRDKKGNSIPIYLKENNICGSFKIDMQSSYVTEVRIDYDYQAKELSWFCTQDSPSMGSFEKNLLLDVLVY